MLKLATGRNSIELARRRTVWILVACAVGAAVFVLGVLAAASGTALGATAVTTRQAVLVVVTAFVGRLVMIVVQTEVVAAAGGSAGRDTPVRQLVFAAVVDSQPALVVRDVLLGVLGLAGVLGAARLVSLAGNLFDPFVLWAALRFWRRLRDDSAVHRGWGQLLAYTGYLLVSKIVLSMTAGMLVSHR